MNIDQSQSSEPMNIKTELGLLRRSSASKKVLSEYTIVYLQDGNSTFPLNGANLHDEACRIGLPDYLVEYLSAAFGQQPVEKSHIPLTKLCINKHLIAKGSAEGHFVFLPKGQFICDAIEQYGYCRLTNLFPTMKLKVPVVFQPNTPAMHTLTDKFGKAGYNRMVPVMQSKTPVYNLQTYESDFYLRYAADPDLFNLLEGKTFHREELPIAFYSAGDTVRNDPEVAGIVKTTEFYQPDYHVVTQRADALSHFIALHELTADVMRRLTPLGCRFIIVDIEASFLDSHSDYLEKVARCIDVPIVVKVLRERVHYYSVQHQYFSIT